MKIGALVTVIVVDDLHAIPLAVDYTEAMMSLTHRYRWTAHERTTPADSWRDEAGLIESDTREFVDSIRHHSLRRLLARAAHS